MSEFVPYLIPALVALVLIAATIWIVYVNLRRSRPKAPEFIEPDADREQPSIVVPTQDQLRTTFEAYQQGGKEGLLKLFEERQRQDEQNSPEESLAQRPDETFGQYLKRLSQMPQIGDGFVKLSNLGPITIISTGPAKPPKDDPKS